MKAFDFRTSMESEKAPGTPKRGPLGEAIDKVNEMFRAKGVDVNPASVAGFITTSGDSSTRTKRRWRWRRTTPWRS